MSLGAPGSVTILVAEDDEAIRPVLRRVLQRSGYTVLVASDGQEAIAIAERHVGAIDLVITDLMMPGMTGDELIARLKTLYPSVRVLLMSGYSDEAVQSAEPGAAKIAFLQKPFALDDLTRKVREV